MSVIEIASSQTVAGELGFREELSEIDKLLAVVQHVSCANMNELEQDVRGGLYLLMDHVREKVREIK